MVDLFQSRGDRVLQFLHQNVYIINAKKTAPYVAFGFVFTNNISLCYDTFRKRFKEIKKITFKYCKKKIISLQNVEIIRRTLPVKLFWYINFATMFYPLSQRYSLCLPIS